MKSKGKLVRCVVYCVFKVYFRNLLLPEGVTTERVRANYIFNVYKGENLIKLKSAKGGIDKSPPNSSLQINFVGLKVN